jgi:peptidoglycan/LPS O-acetylase OafA/YrhL
LIAAGVTSDASQAKGFGDALQLVREAPYGQALLAAVALGLIAFGAYQLVEARYRRLFGRAADGTYGRRQLEETWRLERHARRHAPVSTRAHSHE